MTAVHPFFNRVFTQSLLGFVLLVIFACAPVSIAVSQEIRVLTVNLAGNSIPGLDVRVDLKSSKLPFPESKNSASADGVATIQLDDAKGVLKILVNMDPSEKNQRIETNTYIGRVKRVTPNDLARLAQGFAIPLWAHHDVKSLSALVVRNPDHIGVFVRRPQYQGDRSSIIMKLGRDQYQNIDQWISYWAPELPQFRDPELARKLFDQLEPGDLVPEILEADLQTYYDEVDRQNSLARLCRQQVAAGLFPPPPNVPGGGGGNAGGGGGGGANGNGGGGGENGNGGNGGGENGNNGNGGREIGGGENGNNGNGGRQIGGGENGNNGNGGRQIGGGGGRDDVVGGHPNWRWRPNEHGGGRGINRTRVHYYSSPTDIFRNFFDNLNPLKPEFPYPIPETPSSPQMMIAR